MRVGEGKLGWFSQWMQRCTTTHRRYGKPTDLLFKELSAEAKELTEALEDFGKKTVLLSEYSDNDKIAAAVRTIISCANLANHSMAMADRVAKLTLRLVVIEKNEALRRVCAKPEVGS